MLVSISRGGKQRSHNTVVRAITVARASTIRDWEDRDVGEDVGGADVRGAGNYREDSRQSTSLDQVGGGKSKKCVIVRSRVNLLRPEHARRTS